MSAIVKWTAAEAARASALRKQGHTLAVIAKIMGRSAGSVMGRYETFGPSFERQGKWFGHYEHRALDIDPGVLAERERCYALPDRRPTVGKMMGDPLPGRSALDTYRPKEGKVSLAWLRGLEGRQT